MWDFSSTAMTFNNPAYLFDGTGPGGGVPSPVLPGPVTFGGRVIIPAKKLGETVVVPCDFLSRLSLGETITSASCTCVVYAGVDPSPANVISGTATVSGSIVNQLITGGVLGVIYELLFRAVTSLGQVLELSAYLTIVPDLP